MGDVPAYLVAVGVGLLVFLNVGGIANVLAGYGRRQERRWGRWITAGTPKTPAAVRLIGLAIVLLSTAIAIWPPS